MRQVTELQEPLQVAIADLIRVFEEHCGPFLPIQRRVMTQQLMAIAEVGMKQERNRMRELALDENCEAMFITGCPLFRHPARATGILVARDATKCSSD